MNTVNALVAQSRDREVARAASHPSRLMAHDLRRARRAGRGLRRSQPGIAT